MRQESSSSATATLGSYSLGRVLAVAVVLALAPLAGLVALSVPSLAVAFLVGMLSVGLLAAVRTRDRRRSRTVPGGRLTRRVTVARRR